MIKAGSPIKSIVIQGVSEEMWSKFQQHAAQIGALIDARPGAMVASFEDAPALDVVKLELDAGPFVADANEATEAATRLDAALGRLRGKLV